MILDIEDKPKIKVKITRQELEQVKKEYAEDKGKNIVRTFKWPWSKKMQMNQSAKKPDEICVFLLNLKRVIEGPIITKIYGGNFLVIRHHVYRFNPERVFTMGKYKAVIAREFDRELVGIQDYEELVRKDYASKTPGERVNINDPVLIKAIIQARLSEKQPMAGGSKWIIIALVIVGLIVGFFLLTGKK